MTTSIYFNSYSNLEIGQSFFFQIEIIYFYLTYLKHFFYESTVSCSVLKYYPYMNAKYFRRTKNRIHDYYGKYIFKISINLVSLLVGVHVPVAFYVGLEPRQILAVWPRFLVHHFQAYL